MLTDKECKNAVCPVDKKRARFTDSGGLYLEVSPAGSKRWFWKLYIDGKESRMALGSYPSVGLADARSRLAARIASSTSVSDQAQGIAIRQFMNFARVQPNGQGLPIPRLADRVRQLLRLRDDRDLRRLPAAAPGIDAVRLMTIHGSKGLQFPVVHMVGVNQDAMPGPTRPSKWPPPTGMVTGGAGSPDEIERAAHNEEQECLFYVAMSRAKDLPTGCVLTSCRTADAIAWLQPRYSRMALTVGRICPLVTASRARADRASKCRVRFCEGPGVHSPGLLTPTCRYGKAGCTWPSWSTCSPAASWVGG